MSTEGNTNASVSRDSMRRGHEQSDAHAGWIFGAVFFLVIAGIIIHFIVAAILTSFIRKAPPQDQWRPPAPAAWLARTSAPFPRLQISPPADLEKFRAREE